MAVKNVERLDPIAQTFMVEGLGIYLTKVDLFFANKASNADLPVVLQIRPAFSGFPDPEIVLENSIVTKRPSAISTSTDGKTATTFTFEEPVFLEGGKEYAIVIQSNAAADAYKLWTSKLGNFYLGSTTKRATTDPVSGVFFKSSNGRTFDADQTTDLCYRLYRAKFKAKNVNVRLEAAPPPAKALLTNPLLFNASDATVHVIHPDHGFIVNDYVRISSDSDGIDSADTINGIKGSSILGKRLVTSVDFNGYTFEMDSAASASIRAGGVGILASQQFIMDQVKTTIDILQPPSTNVVSRGTFTTSKSFAGDETEYSRSSNTSIVLNEDLLFFQPHVIGSEYTDSALGAASTYFDISLSTKNNAIAPVVDMQRASLITINNIIDWQDSAATTGRNVPISFTAETDPSGGSAAAKHITRRVDLEQSARGVKIYVDANRAATADFSVYYRVLEVGAEGLLDDVNWTEVSYAEPLSNHNSMPTDTKPQVFREYRYIVGGEFAGNIQPFSSYQVKIVMHSQSSSNPPRFKRLRTIALGD